MGPKRTGYKEAWPRYTPSVEEHTDVPNSCITRLDSLGEGLPRAKPVSSSVILEPHVAAEGR